MADGLVAQLRDAEEPVRLNAVALLTQQVNEAFGASAASLAEELRATGGVQILVDLLGDANPEVQQCAMSVLGNLLTNIFEPNAAQSLTLFDESGGMQRLIDQLGLDFPHNLYAAACMQNVTAQSRCRRHAAAARSAHARLLR